MRLNPMYLRNWKFVLVFSLSFISTGTFLSNLVIAAPEVMRREPSKGPKHTSRERGAGRNTQVMVSVQCETRLKEGPLTLPLTDASAVCVGRRC